MLNSLDLLGPDIKLTINSQPNFKTSFGAFTSLILILLGFTSFIGLGKDIFLRKVPKVTYNKIVNDLIPSKNITGSNFLISIYDQASDKPIIDFERRFFPSFDYYNTFSNGTTIVRKRIPLEKCLSEVINQWNGYFARVGSENYICFPQNKTWPLSGIILQGNYTSIRIQLEFCQNNTDPKIGPVRSDCISKKDTINYLSGKRIQLHYIIETILIDTFNYTSPGSITAVTGYTNTDPLNWNRLTVLFSDILVQTDEGFFIESNSIENFESVHSIQSEAIYSPQTNAIFSHLLGNSRYKEVYKRSYIKIQDIFAIMGGFIHAATIILRFFVNYTQKPKMVDIFNNIIKLKSVNFSESSTKINKQQKQNDNFDSQNMSRLKFFENNNPIHSSYKINVVGRGSIHKTEEIKKNPQQLNRCRLEIFDYINQIKQDKVESGILFQKIKILENQKYSFKLNIFETIFKFCIKTNKKMKNHIDNYIQVEKKLAKTISLENLTKNTILIKFLKEMLFENYHKKILQICQYPKREKNKSFLYDDYIKSMEQAIRSKGDDKVNIMFLEYLNLKINQ